MARTKTTGTLRLTIPTEIGTVRIPEDALDYIWAEIETQADSLVSEAKILRLYERFHEERKKQAAHVRKALTLRQREAKITTNAAGEKQENTPSIAPESASTASPLVVPTASIDLPPGKEPSPDCQAGQIQQSEPKP